MSYVSSGKLCHLPCVICFQGDEDEDFLVENEEEVDIKAEVEKTQVSKEYLGKLQYKVGHFLYISTYAEKLHV